MVEKQDTDHCSVLGGQQMILTGQNFSSDSKVVFMEKSQGEWPATEAISCPIWTGWIFLPVVCMMQMKKLQLCFPSSCTSAQTSVMSLTWAFCSEMSSSAPREGLIYLHLSMETLLY